MLKTFCGMGFILCYSCGFPRQQTMLKTFPDHPYFCSEDNFTNITFPAGSYI